MSDLGLDLVGEELRRSGKPIAQAQTLFQIDVAHKSKGEVSELTTYVSRRLKPSARKEEDATSSVVYSQQKPT